MRGAFCINRRVVYLTLIVVLVVILTAISFMVNSQNVTQNSRASENFKPTKIPTPKPTIKTYYIKPIMNVCFDTLSEIAQMPMYTGIDAIYEYAWQTCYEDLNSLIISNNGDWPGPLINLATNSSPGFSAADKVAATWLKNNYLKSLYNYPDGMRKVTARDVIMKNLAKQRELLTEPLKFSR